MKRNEANWNEKKWMNEWIKWNEMKWEEWMKLMKWINELNEFRWKELKWMKENLTKWNEMK